MDKKTKFFKTVLLLQFVLALLLGFLSLMNFRPQKLLHIRGFYPYEFNYGHAVPLIFFIVSFFLSFLTFFSKDRNAPETEADLQKRNRQKNFWKFAFYCNLFFLLIISLFLIGICQKEPIIINEPIMFYIIVFARSILVILLSLIVASFLLSAGIYWKTNKTMGSVILIFGLLIICTSLFFELLFVAVSMEHSEIYINNRNEKRISADSAVELSEDYTEESEEEDSEAEISKLVSSWDSLIPDWGGLEGKYDFYDVRILIGKSLEEHIVENDHYYVVEYIENLKERPDELYSEFELYRPVIFSLIPVQTYHISNFDKILDGLLLTYDDIGAENEKLNEIYKGMNIRHDGPGPNMDQYYSHFEKHFSSGTIEKLQDYTFSGGSKFKDSDIMWFYSFWARRNHEGNSKEIAIILNEIKEYYNSEEE